MIKIKGKMSTKNITPLESVEQKTFVAWLELQGLLFTAIPNSTYTTSWAVKRRNYEQGLRKGLPDMLVIVPKNKSKDGNGYCLFIELKRVSGGVLSKEQKTWLESINALETPYTQAYIAKGAAEAKRIVSHYLRDIDSGIF